MKQSIILLSVLSLLFTGNALSQSTNSEVDITPNQTNNNCGLAHPDSETKIEVYQTENEDDNAILFSQFESDLERETFLIHETKLKQP